MRKLYGIHSTPRSIARYIVEHLPVEQLGQDERVVIEPCAGHAVFLVAALKRLRDLLGPDWTGQARHRYFAKRLQGFEQDPFAREISKLCLTLADFPNPNGWSLEKADVFTSRRFIEALADARIALCNPPFEEFKASERRHYGTSVGASKPLEVLNRVSPAHPSCGDDWFCLATPLPRRSELSSCSTADRRAIRRGGVDRTAGQGFPPRRGGNGPLDGPFTDRAPANSCTISQKCLSRS